MEMIQVDLQGRQKALRMRVTVHQPRRRIQSATAPNPKAQIRRATCGKLDRKPAEERLKPSTSLRNLGVAVIRKNRPHMLP